MARYEYFVVKIFFNVMLMYFYEFFDAFSRLPYTHTNLLSQILHCINQIAMITAYFASYFSSLTIFLSFIFYIEAFCNDFNSNFNRIDEIFKGTNDRVGKKRIITKNILIDSIKIQEISSL